MNWDDWFQDYESSPGLRARLKIVREQIAVALVECPPGPIKVLSICAGDGRDLLGALIEHSRRNDVSAVLLDNHSDTISRGRSMAEKAGLSQHLQFVHADATLASNYAGIGHADLVLLSGFLGHLRHNGALDLIAALPMFCKTGGEVIWNRHLILHEGMEQISRIREQFQRTGFREMDFTTTTKDGFGVGRMKFSGEPVPLDTTRKLFEFVGINHFLNCAEKGEPMPEPPHPSPLLHPMEERERAVPSNGSIQSCREKDSQNIPERFEEIATLHSTSAAIGSGEWQPTYSELNHAANAFARVLVCNGVAPSDRVAVLMRQDSPLVATVIAILKAAGIVVVLNPSDPPGRLRQVLDDAEPALIVSDCANEEFARQIAAGKIRVIQFGKPSAAKSENLEFKISPGAVAFLIYTSGSTGGPKGVMQTHRNILHNANRLSRPMMLRPGDRNIFLASLSGGQGLSTTWCALLNGCVLCPFPIMERGVAGLAEWLREHRISVWVSSSSVFRSFMKTLGENENFPDMRLVRLGSEPANDEDVAVLRKHFRDDCILFHTLSSSEAGNITHSRVLGNTLVKGRLPAGNLSDGMEILLLDESGREVAPGEIGEVFVRSQFLSPGYWRNDSLTWERFLTGERGVRIFRSGDLGRRAPDGQLVFIGRKDAQVKINGYRVEIPEVENALARCVGVEKAVVHARTPSGTETQLVAFVVVRPGQNCDAETLRKALRATLPGYMIPARFIFLNTFPLTAHGKIDREALDRLVLETTIDSSAETFANETEIQLAEIWRQVFGRNAISRQENFFDLGGDSLAATVMASLVHARFGVDLDFRAFAEHPIFSDLARWISETEPTNRVAAASQIPRAPRDERLPLSFEEQNRWKNWRKRGGTDQSTVAVVHQLSGPLDARVFCECVNELANRHEIWRTNFDEINGQPTRIIHSEANILVRQIDLVGVADAEEQVARILREESRRPFDLRHGLLVRLFLARLGENDWRLVRINHHIISDARSWQIYFRDLAALYETKLRRQPSPFPKSEPLQYADYAAWQQRKHDPTTPEFRELIQWWKNYLTNSAQKQNRFGGREWMQKIFGARIRMSELPLKRTHRDADAKRGDGLIFWGVDPRVTRRLDQIDREEGVTIFMSRLAVFAAQVARETRRSDVLISTAVSNRNRQDLQNIFGFFSHSALLRLHCDFQRTFRQWLGDVRVAVNEMQSHAMISEKMLRCELRKSRVELSKRSICFALADHTKPIYFGEIEMKQLGSAWERECSGFHVTFDQHDEAAGCHAMFDARVYHPEKVQAFLERLKCSIGEAAGNPDAILARLFA